MSLDVYLTAETAKPTGEPAIYIRSDGATKRVTRAEWDELFPDREPFIAEPSSNESPTVYSRNITHNLGKMADAAGIYKYLWRPDENGITKASQLIQPLRDGLAALNTDPDKFKAFNPSNGWGNYEGLCDFVTDYLQACEEYPDAAVSVSR